MYLKFIYVLIINKIRVLQTEKIYFAHIVILTYITIVCGIRLLGANAVYRGNADIFALLHRAMFELYPLQ